jgi:hypothetical protein
MNVNANSIRAARIRVALTLIGYFAFGTIFSLGARAECGVAARSLAALAPAAQAIENSAAVSPEGPSSQADWLQAQPQAGSDIPIIGLWNAIWVSSGTTVDVGFDQWHSDGTEVLNDTPPPASGNVCLGTSEKIAPRTYSLVHPAFNFDAAGTTLVSIFIEREQVTVLPDGNNFTDIFTWDSYDFSGQPFPGYHLTGILTGKRIEVNAPFPFSFPL